MKPQFNFSRGANAVRPRLRAAFGANFAIPHALLSALGYGAAAGYFGAQSIALRGHETSNIEHSTLNIE